MDVDVGLVEMADSLDEATLGCRCEPVPTATVAVGSTSIPTRSAPGSGDVFEAAASVDVLDGGTA